jgi:hypothetical protein
VVPDSGGTFSGNLTLNGTANTAPNQTAASGSSLMTRDLGDDRYSLSIILDQDATRTSTTSLTDIAMGSSANHPQGLSVFGCNIAANERISLLIILQVTDASNPQNQKFDMSGPSGFSWVLGLSATGIAGSPATYNYGSSTAGTMINGIATGTAGGIVLIRGVVTNGANAGTVALRFAQNSSSGTTATVKAGSSICVIR